MQALVADPLRDSVVRCFRAQPLSISSTSSAVSLKARDDGYMGLYHCIRF